VLSPRSLTGRLRPRIRPILQTAFAAAAAWALASRLLPDGRPSFAAIAAVICVGLTYGQRLQRAVQLTCGVVLGISIASAIVPLIGTGSAQIGLMVVVAMTAAVLLGGGELLISEAAVSAILLVSLAPGTSAGFTPDRILEALIGGGVSVAVAALLFPPDPSLEVGRAAQALFGALGGALDRLAAALADRDPEAAAAALADTREIDPLVAELGTALATGRETARLAPVRRTALVELERYGASFSQLDFAVRDARVLARHSLRLLRSGEDVPDALPDGVRALGMSVWELAGAYERPQRCEPARDHAVHAGALAAAVAADGAGAAALEVGGQLRSTAVDLRRAADLVAGTAEPAHEAPTEELLIAA
jgi:uncharacterized membrane protein YgaE (UPF0421/DUF939 family)